MAKVVHLTSVHSLFDVRIFHKEAKTLQRAGYTVTLVVPDPRVEQIVDGVHIKTLAVPSNRLSRLTRTVWQVYQAARKEAADVYHLHDPELLFVGWLLSLQGKKVIYDAHEDVPKQILAKHWIPVWMRKWVAGLTAGVETLLVCRFAGVITATPAIARRFPASKTVVIQNFPLLDELRLDDGSSVYQERPNNIVYMGGITQNRGAYQMIEAVGKLSLDLRARLILAGKFTPAELGEKLRQLDAWEKVEFLEWLSREQLREVLKVGKIGLVLLHPVPNHVEAQPIKLFEFMSASLPVIASDFPLWREIVRGAGCGLLVDPLDTQAITEAMRWLIEHPEEAEAMGKRGRKAVEVRYNWEAESEKLLNFYEGLFS